MKTLRVGVFETNSSSEHLICFPCASAYANLHVDPCMVKAAGDGNYDWGYDVLEEPGQLIDYWLVAISMNGAWADQYNDNRDSVVEYFASKQVELVIPKYVNEITGYIDHQSVHSAATLAAFLLDPEALFNFVFCPESKIIIDNDNR